MDRPPVIVLDACVLYPSGLRNLMMWLTVNEVIRARWSTTIHEEWMRNLLAKRPDLTQGRLERTRDLMDRHAEDSLVTGFERHLGCIDLPDSDDKHVLAVAIECGAEAIATWNVGDFPPAYLAEFGIAVVSPDALLCDLLDTVSDDVIAAMKEHRQSLKNPVMKADAYLLSLKRQGLNETVALLEPRKGEL